MSHNNLKKKEVAKKMKNKFDLVGSIMAHEDGTLDEKGTRRLFRHLQRTGLGNKLQGHYGRTIATMERSGYLKPRKENLENKLDKFNKKNKDSNKNTKYLDDKF